MRARPMVKGTLKGKSCVKDPPSGYMRSTALQEITHTHQHEDTTAVTVEHIPFLSSDTLFDTPANTFLAQFLSEDQVQDTC